MRAIGSRLRDVDTLLAPAVADTLAHLADGGAEDVDAGAVKLAARYAAAIDEAANIAADLADALADVDVEDVDTAARLRTLARRVEAQAVLAELGPKLLQALESLGATPRARAAFGKGGGRRGPSKLEGIRATARG